MDRRILNLIKEFKDEPFDVDRIIVSTFLSLNNLEVKKNHFLKKYVIQEDKNELKFLKRFSSLIKEKFGNSFTIERLIELFEFVISPKEKVVTGAVYTPERIRQYIVTQTIPTDGVDNAKIADIACGCAGFLLTCANHLKKHTKKTYKQIISENLYGLDIANYSINRSKIVLSLLALISGEDTELEFNLFVGNSLNYDWRQRNSTIRDNNGFDYVVGNPPYVCSRNIDDGNRSLLSNWQVASSGHPDLYIPFFEVGIQLLANGGILGYITVNTFFKSINGRALRQYFSDLSYQFKIIDFRNEQVFQKRNTYTCICFIKKGESDFIEYTQAKSTELSKINSSSYARSYYQTLDHFNGWNLGSKNVVSTIRKIESFKEKIFDNFSFSTGIATLKNNIYKFKAIKKDGKFYYFKKGEKVIKIEKSICREIINSNKISTEAKLESLKEHIIFPYAWNRFLKKHTIIPETQFKTSFPEAYSYLATNKKELAKRDKAKKKYEAWYAYGRNQSLDILGTKLFLPHITNDPSFVLSNDTKLLFYNGEAIVGTDEFELKVLKKIMESEIFWFYIRNTSKPYASDYFSLGKNYMKQFSIPELTLEEKRFLLKASNVTILKFLLNKYGLAESEITL